MAAKKNKAKKLSNITRSKSSWPWSQLPQTLVQMSCTTQSRFQYCTSRGTTKSWLTTRSRCNATSNPHRLLQLINHDSIFKVNSSTTCPQNLYYLDNNSCISSLSQGSYWCILKVDTTSRAPPPISLNHENNDPVIFLSYVGLIGDDIPSSSLRVTYTVYHNPYGDKYVGSYKYVRNDRVCVRHECATVDPFDAKKRYMEFTSVVQLESKYYALSVQGTIVVMQDVGSRLVITGISTSRGVPSGSCRFFKQYLVELKGQILLIFLIHRKSIQVVDEVEVFGLDFVELEWIKVERIQGKTLLLDEECMWTNSSEVGCKGNCVYFTQGSDNEWCMYDMETCCILHA